MNFRTVKLRGKAAALKSLQAKQIFSPTNMKIASPTKTLKMESVEDLNLKTAIGKLHIKALKMIDMEARNVSKIFPRKASVFLSSNLSSVHHKLIFAKDRDNYRTHFVST